jgi:ABC-type cobalamin/Fe3+-siderophores transport system ATPase subunit
MSGPNFTNLVYVAGRKGCGKTTLLHALVQHGIDTKSGALFICWDSTREWQAGPGKIVLPSNQYSPQQAAQFALDHAPAVLVMDEVDRAVPNVTNALPADTPLHRVIQYGRHEDVALWCAARRSVRVHTDIRALADVIYLFKHTEPRDLQWISEVCGNEVAAQVPQLERRKFIRCVL